MKSVLLSIRPKWCEKIARGEKTIEIRKSRPNLETPFKVYIYCTNTRPYLVWGDVFRGNWETEFTHLSGYNRKDAERIWDVFNGKVIGEFVCRNIDEYAYDYCPHPEIGMDYDCGDNWWEVSDEDLKRACLTESEFRQYAWPNKIMYGWHISDLVIYDTPKPLGGFYKPGAESMEELEELLCLSCEATEGGKYASYGTPNGPVTCEGRFCDEAYQNYLDENFALTRPPQSWCYVEEVKA